MVVVCENNAAASAASASLSETNAAASETAAALSETNAALSASQAANSKTVSDSMATNAALSETNSTFWAEQAESFAVAAEAAAVIVADATGLNLQTLIVSARRGSDYRTLGIELF